jgi:hypothetical protein
LDQAQSTNGLLATVAKAANQSKQFIEIGSEYTCRSGEWHHQ